MYNCYNAGNKIISTETTVAVEQCLTTALFLPAVQVSSSSVSTALHGSVGEVLVHTQSCQRTTGNSVSPAALFW